MKNNLKSFTAKDYILRKIRRNGRGYVFTPGDLQEAGSRAAIDKALGRLVEDGTVRRLGRGVYDYPKESKRLGHLTPSAMKIARAIARREQSNVLQSGSRSANSLGISTQVPSRPVYLTTGTSRTRRVAGYSIELRRVVPKRVRGSDSEAAVALEAIRYLGKARAQVQDVIQVLARLPEVARPELGTLARHAPEWLRRLVENAEEQLNEIDRDA